MAQGTAEFLAAGIPALCVAIVMYILFCVCRQKFPEIYEPRTKMSMVDMQTGAAASPGSKVGWLPHLLKISLEQLAQTSGVDAAARVVFQGTMLVLFVLLVVGSCCSLIPLYATGSGGFSEFEQLTMANVGDGGGRRHMVIAVMCWAASLAMYGIIYLGIKAVAGLHLAERARLCHYWRQVVRTTRIPEGCRTQEGVKEHFEKSAPGQVLYVQPIKDLGKKQDGLVPKYTKSWRALKHAEAVQKDKPEKKQTVKTGFLGLVGPKKDAIEHHSAKVEEYREALTTGAEAYHGITNWTSAFVAFSSPKSAAEAVVQTRGKEWECTLAPAPREILWQNMCKGRNWNQEFIRAMIAGLLAAVVILLFFPVMFFVQSICNLDDLSREYSWLSWMQDIDPAVRGLLQGLLPVVIVIVFNALVVPVMEFLAGFGGVDNQYDLNRRVLWYYLSHLVFNCFFVMVASGSLLDSMKEIIDNPSSLGTFLGDSLPKVSTYFILILMVQALGGAPGKLALLGKVIVGKIKLKYLAKTDFEKVEATAPSYAEFKPGVDYATDVYICIICLAYSFIAPIASVFGLLYFLLNTITTKYLVHFYFKTPFNSSGKLSISGFRGVLLALMVGQLVVLLALALQKSGTAAGSLAPLPIFSLIGAVAVDLVGPGRTIMWDPRDGTEKGFSSVQPLDDEVANQQAKDKLIEAQVSDQWRQPSFNPNFSDPVRDRFDWIRCEDV